MVSYLLVVNPGNAIPLGIVAESCPLLLRLVWSSPECCGN